MQAERTLESERLTFQTLLAGLLTRAGLSASKFQLMLVRQGYDCTAESVRRWLRGTSVPPADVIPYLLKALEDVLPKEDVQAAFQRFAQMSYLQQNSQAVA